nr:hypothetical protein [Sulfurospirillum sp. 'SP']
MGKIKRGNVRHESYTIKQRVDEVIHDLRYEKTIHMTDDENLKFKNVIFEKSKRFYFEYGHQENKKSIDKIKEDILDEITKTREEHKLLFKKYNKRSLREEKYNSINRGILTFENQRFKSKTKQEKEKFIKDGYERIKKYCELKKIKLLYVVYHDDEESGHFHYMTSNFYEEDNKLKSLNIKKNKNMGKELQDFYYENFTKNHGYERGLSKELTKRKHQKLGTSEREQILESVKREVSIEIQTLKNKVKEEKENVKNKVKIIEEYIQNETKLNTKIYDLHTDKVDIQEKLNTETTSNRLKEIKLKCWEIYDDLKDKITEFKRITTDEQKTLHKLNKKRITDIKKREYESEIDKIQENFRYEFQMEFNGINFKYQLEDIENEKEQHFTKIKKDIESSLSL